MNSTFVGRDGGFGSSAAAPTTGTAVARNKRPRLIPGACRIRMAFSWALLDVDRDFPDER
jgi:hypothetical protein